MQYARAETRFTQSSKYYLFQLKFASEFEQKTRRLHELIKLISSFTLFDEKFCFKFSLNELYLNILICLLKLEQQKYSCLKQNMIIKINLLGSNISYCSTNHQGTFCNIYMSSIISV